MTVRDLYGPDEWRPQTDRQTARLCKQGRVGLDPTWATAGGQAALANDDIGRGARSGELGCINQIGAACGE